uniref:CASP-like protein n=1 Tax=Caenorhabditis tropicalis TaxID=1561998 RepID=A0A1I7UGT4_9PELO
MQTSTIIFVCNVALVMASITGLCLCSSVFDFIVVSKLYYTVPDHKILINPLMAFWIFPASALSLLLSFLSLIFLSAGPRVVKFAVDHQMILSFFHGFFLCVAAILSSYVSLLCAQNANDISGYAAFATPAQFQLASAWYYSRLRALMVFSIIQSLLNAIVISFLYLGISCKYRTFIEVSEKPTHPDLVERTTYFA